MALWSSFAAHCSLQDIAGRRRRWHFACSIGTLRGMSPDVTRKGRPGKPGPAAPRSRAANAARRFVVAILFGCLIAGLIPFAGFTLQPAQAASSLTAAQKEFKQAKAELAAIQAQLDRLAQKQEDAEVRLSKTLDSIDKVQTKTEKAKKDLAVSQA